MKSNKLYALFCRFRRDEAGVTAVEYGVIAAAVCLAVAAVIWGFGAEIAGTFTSLQEGMAAP